LIDTAYEGARDVAVVAEVKSEAVKADESESSSSSSSSSSDSD
jgi:hypothetical protein